MNNASASKTLRARINGHWPKAALVFTIAVAVVGWYRSIITADVLAGVHREAVDGEISTVKQRVETVEKRVGHLSRVTDRIGWMVEQLSLERGLGIPKPIEPEPIEQPEGATGG
jgi:hypothetical protein